MKRKLRDMEGKMRVDIHIIRILGENRENGKESLFEKIIAERFTHWWKTWIFWFSNLNKTQIGLYKMRKIHDSHVSQTIDHSTQRKNNLCTIESFWEGNIWTKSWKRDSKVWGYMGRTYSMQKEQKVERPLLIHPRNKTKPVWTERRDQERASLEMQLER